MGEKMVSIFLGLVLCFTNIMGINASTLEKDSTLTKDISKVEVSKEIENDITKKNDNKNTKLELHTSITSNNDTGNKISKIEEDISNINKSKSMEFYKKSSELVRKNWNEDYFKSIKLKVGENYLINDSNKKVKLSSKVYIKNDEIMVPVNAIINLSGGKINKDNKNIQINYLGNSVELKEGSEKIEVNDKDKSIGGKVTVDDNNVIVPIDVLSKGLGYTYKYDKISKEIELESPYQTMRLIVKLKNANTDLSKYKSVESIKGLNNIFVLQFKSIEDTKLAYEQIEKDNIAVYAEPDYYVSSQSTTKASSDNGSAAYNSWGVEYIEAEKYANYLSKQNITNSITVGVVDSGIDYNHSIFSNRINSLGYDFVNSDYYPYDDNGHGTHVSGTIVDCTPGLDINIFPVKVLGYDGRGTALNAVNGIEYAAYSGVDVINFSIGMNSHWNYLHDVIENAILNNVVVVLAAGNDSNNTFYECPSDMYNPIVVSAIDNYGEKCYFSNYGSTIDVAAPGYYIYSAYPGGGYAYMSGTSMAAPHISAVCAMYRLKYPNLNAYEVENLVQKNTKDLGSTGWDQYYGYGVPHLSLDIPSNEKPVISGANSKTIKVGDDFNAREGVSASDKEDGDLTSKIQISGNVNTTKSGKYNITYKVIDSDNNEVSKSIVITVNAIPVIKANDKTIKVGDSLNLRQDVSASDEEDGNLTSKIQVSGNVNTTKAGKYKVTYSVWDNQGASCTKTITVSVYPKKAQNVRTTSKSYNSIMITWDKLEGIDGYEIYQSTSTNGTYSLKGTVTSASTLSYTNTSLTTGKTYYYKVRGYGIVNGEKIYGEFSSVSSAKPTLALTIGKATSKSYNSILVSWNKVSGADGYNIYRSTSNNGTYSLVKTVTSGSTLSYTNTSLTTGKTYYYKIKSYKNVNGSKVYSNYSSIFSAKPLLSKPSVTLSEGTKKVYVKWTKVSGASGYEIYRSTSKSGTYSKVKTITSGKTTSYTNTGLTSKKTYYYKVRAYRTVSGNKVYSSYDTIKYIKVK